MKGSEQITNLKENLQELYGCASNMWENADHINTTVEGDLKNGHNRN